MIVRDEWAEDEVQPDPDVAEREAQKARSQPAVPANLAPAVGEVVPKTLGRRPDVVLDAQGEQEGGADEEARCVDCEHPAGSGGCDDRP